MQTLTPKERDVIQCLQGVDGYDEGDKRFLMEQLGLSVTDLNPPPPVEPRPTLSQLLRERAWELWSTICATVWGAIWAPFMYAWSLLFCTAAGVAVLKIASVVIVHVFVWAAWTAIIGPVPRAALYFVYSSILTVVMYAWLFCHQLPLSPAQRISVVPHAPTMPSTPSTPSTATPSPPRRCRCGKTHCSAPPYNTPDFPGEYVIYNDMVLQSGPPAKSRYKSVEPPPVKAPAPMPTAKPPVEPTPVKSTPTPTAKPSVKSTPTPTPTPTAKIDPELATQMKQAYAEVESLRFQAAQLSGLLGIKPRTNA